MAPSYFADIPPIRFEGADSVNPLAYRYYEKDRLVIGKRMEDHLRMAVCYWHTFCAEGAERVPIAHCHTEMVFHPLADYEAVFFVISICERVDGIGTLETDRRDIGKIRRGHLLSSLKPLQRLKESDYGSAATIVMANALSGRRKAFPESRGGSGQGIAEHGLHLQGSGR